MVIILFKYVYIKNIKNWYGNIFFIVELIFVIRIKNNSYFFYFVKLIKEYR